MRRTPAQGFALTTVLLLLIVLMALVTAYFFLTNVELSTVGASTASITGFYAAEAGLNLRGEEIRSTFQAYNRPAGKLLDPKTACKVAGGPDYTPLGTTDRFYCRDIDINDRQVVTYVVQDPRNLDPNERSRMVTIQPGEKFAGLNAVEYRYEVMSKSMVPNDTRPEAQLGMVFRSRLVPLFQFAAFYNKDLEISPGANMTLNGRVHVNGDLYLNTGSTSTLNIAGVTTVARNVGGAGGDLYRMRKDDRTCGGTVRVNDAKDPSPTPSNLNTEPSVNCSGKIPQATLDGWNKQILTGLDTITTPEPENYDVGGYGWAKADVRVALDVRGAVPQVIVANNDIVAGNVTADPTLTGLLDSCESTALKPYTEVTDATNNRVAEGSRSFQDTREGKVGGAAIAAGKLPSNAITMLEVDVRGLLTCLHRYRSNFFAGRTDPTEIGINESSEGGLVVYLTVIGPRSALTSSLYGVRVRNGELLAATDTAAPQIRGLTVVSDQAAYIQGNYNRDDRGTDIWRPASFLVDSLNILSERWRTTTDANSSSALSLRPAGDAVVTETRVNAAFLAGTTSTRAEGISGQGGGYSTYNGGLENYPRLHEDWSGRILWYKGSFVSLGVPRRSDSGWPETGAIYNAPRREWSYDVRFNNADNLPPLAPRFVYLRQERFARDFERE